MRLALIPLLVASLVGCGGQPEPAGPERRSAAGEVLGGEVTDDMLPLDTARSTSPPGASTPDDNAENTGTRSDRVPESATPSPILTAAPMPDMTMPADPEPLRPDE